MARDFDRELVKFIAEHPVNYFVIAGQKMRLEKAGYKELKEYEAWKFEPGGRYFVIRNDAALIAFRIPKDPGAYPAFHMMASHSDSPCFKLKESPEIRVENAYTKLNVELYGGAILAPWFDRPLSVAGRLCVDRGNTVEKVLVDLAEDIVLIPNLAIHMNRDINKGYNYNVQKDMLPLYGLADAPVIMERLAMAAGVNREKILGHDLFLYNRQVPSFWGAGEAFVSSPRLDDVQCAFASLCGFLEAEESTRNIPVHVVYDNEEVGSSTRQGAASTFLKDTLNRICAGMKLGQENYMRMMSHSFMLSADNAHALHPNYPEKCDPVNRPVLGGGVVLKFSANQKYTTDGVTAAAVRKLAQTAGVPVQVFYNRSDMPGGSTLGNISGNQVPVPTADVGIAQLAMHSPYETCGTGDTEAMVKLAKALYSK